MDAFSPKISCLKHLIFFTWLCPHFWHYRCWPPLLVGKVASVLFLLFWCAADSQHSYYAWSPPDKLVWSFEKNNIYSVKTSYHSIGLEKKRSSASSSSDANHPLWKKIWKLCLPNSVKNFLWRLLKGILPTITNLVKRGMSVDPICPLCFCDSECENHLFLRCRMAKLYWFASPLGLHILENFDCRCWLEDWLNCKNERGALMVCVFRWKL